MSRRKAHITAVAILTLLMCIGSLDMYGQANLGAISGTATDSSGAVIPGASVTITNEATGLTRTLKSDSVGFYSAEGIATGSYVVTTSSPGFKTSIVRNILLRTHLINV